MPWATLGELRLETGGRGREKKRKQDRDGNKMRRAKRENTG